MDGAGDGIGAKVCFPASCLGVDTAELGVAALGGGGAALAACGVGFEFARKSGGLGNTICGAPLGSDALRMGPIVLRVASALL